MDASLLHNKKIATTNMHCSANKRKCGKEKEFYIYKIFYFHCYPNFTAQIKPLFAIKTYEIGFIIYNLIFIMDQIHMLPVITK